MNTVQPTQKTKKNKGGRPKGSSSITAIAKQRQLLRDLLEEKHAGRKRDAYEELFQMMHDKDPEIRLKAISLVLQKTIPTPRELDVTGPENGPVIITVIDEADAVR